ncbi:MAG: phosphoglycerate kinase [Chloroflexota bacterium]|nr:phosphoglycerate kinase [Chloroflexota bacterium]
MPKRSVERAEVGGRLVLVRVDFNVPLDGDRVTDDTRIRAALPTISHLVERGARVVLVSHLGRPKGKPDPRFRLAPVARRLSTLLGREVATIEAVVGPEAERASEGLANGEILLLENVRFEPGEETNDPDLAAKLAKLADIYVDDAFGAAHRAHASTVGVARLLPAYAGFLLRREVDVLSRLRDAPQRPFVAVLGGAKVSDKLGVVAGLLEQVDVLLLGGGMANTFLLAQGHGVGASLVERDRVEDARATMERAAALGVEIGLPSDAVVAPSLEAAHGRVVPIDAVPDGEGVFDVGPATVAAFGERIGTARTVFWNGPMGVFERSPFAAGTRGVADAIGRAPGYTVVGGGDSVAAVEQMGTAAAVDHISTGGGASLELLEGRELPGVAVLPDEEATGG